MFSVPAYRTEILPSRGGSAENYSKAEKKENWAHSMTVLR